MSEMCCVAANGWFEPKLTDAAKSLDGSKVYNEYIA